LSQPLTGEQVYLHIYLIILYKNNWYSEYS
jgi:hypothetical protein